MKYINLLYYNPPDSPVSRSVCICARFPSWLFSTLADQSAHTFIRRHHSPETLLICLQQLYYIYSVLCVFSYYSFWSSFVKSAVLHVSLSVIGQMLHPLHVNVQGNHGLHLHVFNQLCVNTLNPVYTLGICFQCQMKQLNYSYSHLDL